MGALGTRLGASVMISRIRLRIRSLLPVQGYSSTPQEHVDFSRVDCLLASSRWWRESQFEGILRYLLTGFSAFASGRRGLVFYPGYPSKNGRILDGIEGFARLAFVLCCWLKGQRTIIITDLGGVKHDVLEIIGQGLAAGLNPSSPEYWGRMRDYDPRICQAATLVAGFALAGDSVWPKLPKETRDLFLAWVADAPMLRVPDNNWRLFPIVIGLFVKREAGTPPHDDCGVKTFFSRFYVERGWFRDGKSLQLIDYYNIWIHFFLYVAGCIGLGESDAALADKARREFTEGFSWMFTRHGPPVFGRSICYRLATPLPLVLGSDIQGMDRLARRALDDVLCLFVSRGGLRDGAVTQGYFERDARLTDAYTGPGGGLWSLYALALAWRYPVNHPFWTVAPGTYPVEEGDFIFELEKARIRVIGCQQDGKVTLVRHLGHEGAMFHPQSGFQRMLELLLRRPFRPANTEAKYPKYVNSWPPIFPVAGSSSRSNAGLSRAV
jgi:hypothetical protein